MINIRIIYPKKNPRPWGVRTHNPFKPPKTKPLMDILALHSNCVPHQIARHPLTTEEIPRGLRKTPTTNILLNVGYKMIHQTLKSRIAEKLKWVAFRPLALTSSIVIRFKIR
ncbi:MAG: hypothetical protein AYK18_04375 [Theionarchaea archaeon DG-70]|nr:MAG: hypothetical protein AYK18_04375 [Theionarchaea archaeon DG-70]